MIVIVWCVDLH